MIPRIVIGTDSTEFGFKNRKTEQIKPNTKTFSVFNTERPKIFGSETENQNRINLTVKNFRFQNRKFSVFKTEETEKPNFSFLDSNYFVKFRHFH